jgi:hypothetical protein
MSQVVLRPQRQWPLGTREGLRSNIVSFIANFKTRLGQRVAMVPPSLLQPDHRHEARGAFALRGTTSKFELVFHPPRG